MYTAEELNDLTVPQLKAIIGIIPGNLPITGIKENLVQRIVANLGIIPADHVKLVSNKAPHANNPLPPPPAVNDPLDNESPIDNLITHLKLCDRTMEFFQQENLTVIKDVLLFEEHEITAWDIPARDRKAIRNFAYPLQKEADHPAPIVSAHQPPLLVPQTQPAALPRTQGLSSHHRSRAHEEDNRSVQSIPVKQKKQRSHSSSSGKSDSSSESNRDGSDSESDNELPLHARNLPRPHKFMSARLNNKGKEKKPKALEIDMPEFLTESARIVRQLTDLPSHSETAKEYSAYVEYINQRNCDYVSSAVLRFDDDFRRRAKQLKIALNDSDLRRSLSEKYFHATTRKNKTTNNYAADSNNSYFRAGRSTTAYAPSSSSRQICGQFNAGNCQYGRSCRFEHKCKICFMVNHGAFCCYQRVQQQQQFLLPAGQAPFNFPQPPAQQRH